MSQLIRATARTWIHICMSLHNKLGEKCDADIYTRKKGEQLKNLSHVNFYQGYIMHNYEVSLPWHYGQNLILHLIATYFIHQPYKLVSTCLCIFAPSAIPAWSTLPNLVYLVTIYRTLMAHFLNFFLVEVFPAILPNNTLYRTSPRTSFTQSHCTCLYL